MNEVEFELYFTTNFRVMDFCLSVTCKDINTRDRL